MENENDKEARFIKENPTIFKKYKVKKKLGEGAFGDVYLGSSIENNELVAIKVEPRKIAKPLLETEAFFLYSLRGLGIPEVLSFGRLRNYNVLVEPLLDKSLFDIFTERRKRLPKEDICLIAMQIIDRIQWVHSKNIVHRDIKPDNFLIGRKDPNVIYLIDFGLSKKYKSSTTGKHIRFGFTGKLTGTVRFASANALRGGEQSRRDDLESIGYMIIYFMRGKLPWQNVTGAKKMERYLKIYKMKKNVTPEDLCKSLPKQMTEFMRYIKQLEFEQEPDYSFLRNLFNSILKKLNGTNDQLLFSWIGIKDIPNLKNPVNPATRRDSPQSRLYRKIQKNLGNEHNRNNSSDNDSGQNSYQTCTVAMNTNMGIVNNNSKDTDIETTTTKKLKSKEGLNTMVANLNKTLDEKIVEDFDKPSSNDLGPIAMMNEENNNEGKMKNYHTVNEPINFKKEKREKQKGPSAFSSQKRNQINQNDKSEERIKHNNIEDKKIDIEPIKLEESLKKEIDKKMDDNNNCKDNIIQQNNNNIIANIDFDSKKKNNNIIIDNDNDNNIIISKHSSNIINKSSNNEMSNNNYTYKNSTNEINQDNNNFDKENKSQIIFNDIDNINNNINKKYTNEINQDNNNFCKENNSQIIFDNIDNNNNKKYTTDTNQDNNNFCKENKSQIIFDNIDNNNNKEKINNPKNINIDNRNQNIYNSINSLDSLNDKEIINNNKNNYSYKKENKNNKINDKENNFSNNIKKNLDLEKKTFNKNKNIENNNINNMNKTNQFIPKDGNIEEDNLKIKKIEQIIDNNNININDEVYKDNTINDMNKKIIQLQIIKITTTIPIKF